MKTINQESPTKKALLDAAQNLMLEKGFVATSVDEICRAAKVTKGSFFHYFKSKEEMGMELVQRFSQTGGEYIKTIFDAAGDDPLDKIYAFIDAFTKMEGKGCLVGNFSQELSQTHPAIRALCSKSFDEMAIFLSKYLIQAKKKYAPDASFDPKSLADFYIALGQGSLLVVKAKQDRFLMKKNLIHFKEYLKLLFGR